MAYLQMNCPNCGGQMTAKNNQFVCEHCGTIVLHILDAKIEADVDVMSVEEFSERLEKAKRQFVVRVNQEIEVFDIDTRVINQRIKIASDLLEKGKYREAYDQLYPIERPILAVERLRYLAHYKVKNEYELSYYNGYVDGANYKKLIELCDEQSRATYEKITSFCRENFDARNKIKAEILEIEKLFSVSLYNDASIYAKEMCRKYPASALSWASLIEAKVRNGESDIKNEWKKMKLCYDFYIKDYSSSIEQYVEKEYESKLKKTDYTGKATYYKIMETVTIKNYVRFGLIFGSILGGVIGLLLFVLSMFDVIYLADGAEAVSFLMIPIGAAFGIGAMFVARPVYGLILIGVLYPIIVPIASLVCDRIVVKNVKYNRKIEEDYYPEIRYVCVDKKKGIYVRINVNDHPEKSFD